MAEQKNIALITFTPNYFAFGLRSIDVYLRSLGHNVISVHASSSHRNQNSPLSTYQLDLLAGKCKDCDVIGISVISVHSIQRVRQVCFFLKNNTKAKIVLGGVPVIISPDIFH